MQIFIHWKTVLHVSGVKAPIIRSIKNVPAASGTGHTVNKYLLTVVASVGFFIHIEL